MTSVPEALGAPAIILYRQVNRDDMGRDRPGAGVITDESNRVPKEENYVRIKILTEEGRKYADVEIPYDKDEGTVSNIGARTIKPDGTIVAFDGKVFTKTVVKARGLKFLAKTFTLPAVQVGCIIEYYYTLSENSDVISLYSHWTLSQELFTKEADFAFKFFTGETLPYGVHVTWENMPYGIPQPKEDPPGLFRLHVTNISAFPTEDYMPPEDTQKAHIDFNYWQVAPESDPGRFWSTINKKRDARVEGFVGKPKSLQDEVAQIVAPSDPPEVKLQKIYARVQKLRNTSFEEQKSEEEAKRQKIKAATNAEEVWKHGYGSGTELTWLFLALVRAAGFDARGVWVADRGKYFFDPSLMQSAKLNENLVVVKQNGKDIFCDPGFAFTPFGLLPWPETFVRGLQLDKKDVVWVQTPLPSSDQARTDRKANLTLSETGDLEGKVTVTFTGLRAASMRMEERNTDETERKKFLEDLMKGYIPAASEVKLLNQPEWKDSAVPMIAEYSVKVPGWASPAGHRVMLAAGLFSGAEKHMFDHEGRIYPIYFEYPYSEADDVNIQLPAGWKIASLPEGWKTSEKVLNYNLAAQNNGGTLHLTRALNVDFVLMDQKHYHALRKIFQEIKSADEQQAVLEMGSTGGGN